MKGESLRSHDQGNDHLHTIKPLVPAVTMLPFVAFRKGWIRIEAHIFVAFLAYALHVTLRRRLRDLAPGLTPRSVLEKFGSLQMIDVHLPTTDGRKIIMSRHTQPEPELQILLKQLRLSLPNQPPPRVTAQGQVAQELL